MNKLVELLNEYDKIAPSRLQRKYYSESGHIMYIDEEGEDVDDYRTDYEIISKDYGFIEWLIREDKIDKVKQVIKDIDIWGSDTITGVDTYSDYESLLMLLAIQDEPIEFLISILK